VGSGGLKNSDMHSNTTHAHIAKYRVILYLHVQCDFLKKKVKIACAEGSTPQISFGPRRLGDLSHFFIA